MSDDPQDTTSTTGAAGGRRRAPLGLRILLVAVVLLVLAYVVWRQAH